MQLSSPLFLALDSFHVVVFGFASMWSLRTLGFMKSPRIRVSRNWWFVSVSTLLLFVGAGWQFYLDLMGLNNVFVTFSLTVPASVLLMAGLYREQRSCGLQEARLNDYRAQIEEIFETIIRTRRPDLESRPEVKTELMKLLHWRGVDLSFAVVLAAVDEYGSEDGSNQMPST